MMHYPPSSSRPSATSVCICIIGGVGGSGGGHAGSRGRGQGRLLVAPQPPKSVRHATTHNHVTGLGVLGWVADGACLAISEQNWLQTVLQAKDSFKTIY